MFSGDLITKVTENQDVLWSCCGVHLSFWVNIVTDAPKLKAWLLHKKSIYIGKEKITYRRLVLKLQWQPGRLPFVTPYVAFIKYS